MLDIPILLAARAFSLSPPYRKHPAPYCHLSGHGYIVPYGYISKAETIAVVMVIPAEGPSFGTAPSGMCRLMSVSL